MTVDSATVAPVIRSVHVRRNAEDAFRVFTDRIADWWPLATHSCFEENAAGVAFVEGRLVERSSSGDEAEWGVVDVWEPPTRIAFSWHPGHPSERATRVEVVFEPDADGTRVVLTHTGWDILGSDASGTRENYNSGWVVVLQRYVDAPA